MHCNETGEFDVEPSGVGIIIFVLAMAGFIFNIARTFLAYYLKNKVKTIINTVIPQAPLTADESDDLLRWEMNLITIYIIGFTALFGWLVVSILPSLQNVNWLQPILLGVFFLAVVAALVFQFREKCPRCGFNIGLTSWPILPKTCMSCHIPLKK
jgi:glucan phosphoethanolaminetransferase (alkaline phosphatase superfamily)